MSIKAMQLVLDKSKHKGSALLLEVIIANFAHDDGKGAWPAVETLAAYIRMTQRNTQLLLRTLERSNEMKTVVGGGPYGTNAYEINVEKLEGMKSFHPRRTQYARMKNRGKGMKKSVAIRVKAASPKPNRHLKPSGEPPPAATAVSAFTRNQVETIQSLGVIEHNAIRLAQMPHVTAAFVYAWCAYARINQNVGGGFFYQQMRDRKLPPAQAQSSAFASQWRREIAERQQDDKPLLPK